jgi:hypothetical protein
MSEAIDGGGACAPCNAIGVSATLHRIFWPGIEGAGPREKRNRRGGEFYRLRTCAQTRGSRRPGPRRASRTREQATANSEACAQARARAQRRTAKAKGCSIEAQRGHSLRRPSTAVWKAAVGSQESRRSRQPKQPLPDLDGSKAEARRLRWLTTPAAELSGSTPSTPTTHRRGQSARRAG